LQAEAARLATPGMPPEGQQQLRAIGDTARTALTEMRRLLGVLREDVDADADPGRQPQPGLRQINELLDEARGLTTASTRLIVSGSVTELDPGVDLTAYRIAQEALTNARRHAPGAAVDVELQYRPDALFLRIRDNGPGTSATDGQPAGPAGGHGISGMQERAAMVGGRLTAGSAGHGGFLVEALLPTNRRRP
jgi:signal transduction histidine kinase